MSEMNTEESVSYGADTYDYLDHTETPNTVDEGNESPEAGKVTEGSEETEENKVENKPWEGSKQETPAWARKRFKEYSTSVRDLKEQNMQLMETVKQVLQQHTPANQKLTRADFTSEDEYIDYKAELKAQEQLSKYDESRKIQEKEQVERARLQQAEYSNVRNALTDLPDYDEVIQNGDPDIRLPVNVINHLSISPAGPYVKYRLASDEVLSEQLKQATPQQKTQIISEIHDSVLDFLIARSKSGDTNTSMTSTAPSKPAVHTATKRTAPPKAPPKLKSGSNRDLMSLSGDEYVRARNEQLSKRY